MQSARLVGIRKARRRTRSDEDEMEVATGSVGSEAARCNTIEQLMNVVANRREDVALASRLEYQKQHQFRDDFGQGQRQSRK